MHQDSAADIFTLDEIRAFACHIDTFFLPLERSVVTSAGFQGDEGLHVPLVKSVFITPDLSLWT